MTARDGLRAADIDRDAIVERLAIAMSEGRLRMDEYNERLERAYAARTYADLDDLVADLPSPRPAVRPAADAPPRRRGCCW